LRCAGRLWNRGQPFVPINFDGRGAGLRGKPVAKLVPPDEPEPRAPLFGYMAGTAEIRGDIVNMPHVEWSALTGDEDHLYTDFEPPASSPHVRGSTRPRKHK
jgi:hypothetical protein